MIENKEIEEKRLLKRKKIVGKKNNIQQFMNQKFNDISDVLSDPFKRALGKIDAGFDVFIFGNTGSGKTSFSAQLLKELSPLGKKLHILYEEGFSTSVKMNIERNGLQHLENYMLMDNCSFDDLMYLLARKNSPRIVVIDSLQYARFTKKEWFTLKDKYVKGKKKKIFIVISHADGKKPRGSVAIDALYDAQIKVFVKGKIAFIKSRYENAENFVIWEKGAKDYWGKQYKKMLTKQIF